MSTTRMTALFRSADGRPNLVSVDAPSFATISDVIERVISMGFAADLDRDSFTLFRDHSNARYVADQWLAELRSTTSTAR